MSRSIEWVGVVLTAIAALALCGSAGAETWTHEASADGVERVRVDLAFGEVRIVSHDEPVARFTGNVRGLGASGFQFAVVRNGAELLVTGRAERWLDLTTATPAVSIEILVPVHADVDVATNAGAVHIESVRGAWVRSGAGPVLLRDIRGPIDIVTGESGAIDIDGVTGSVIADSGDSPIRARFLAAPAGSLKSRTGEIEIAFPTGAGTDLRASAPGGCVFVDREIQAGCGEPVRSVDRSVHGGGPTLEIHAIAGNIMLHSGGADRSDRVF